MEPTALQPGTHQPKQFDLTDLEPGSVLAIDADNFGYCLTVPDNSKELRRNNHMAWWLSISTDDLRIRHPQVAVSRFISNDDLIMIDGLVVHARRVYQML